MKRRDLYRKLPPFFFLCFVLFLLTMFSLLYLTYVRFMSFRLFFHIFVRYSVWRENEKSKYVNGVGLVLLLFPHATNFTDSILNFHLSLIMFVALLRFNQCFVSPLSLLSNCNVHADDEQNCVFFSFVLLREYSKMISQFIAINDFFITFCSHQNCLHFFTEV